MSEYLIVVNPAAKSGKSAELIPLIKQCFADVPHRLMLSEATGHPEAIVREEVTPETCHVVAVGGDGTTGEVLNGLMHFSRNQRPSLGIISAGSGNDAARAFNTPTDIQTAIDALLAGYTRSFDIGKINGRYFASSFSIGLDAMVVEQTLDYKAQKGWAGSRLYYTSLLKVITSKLNPLELEISYQTADNSVAESVQTKILLCATTNGQTYGGGIPINPGARANSGNLSLSWVDVLSAPQILIRLPRIVTGRHTGLKAYHRREVINIVIGSITDTELAAQTDGELFYDTSFKVQVLPAEIDVINPSP